MFGLKAIPLAYWLILAAMLAAISASMLLVLRKRPGRRPIKAPVRRGFWGVLGYVSRLGGFGLLALLLIAGVLIVYIDYQAMVSEMEPARRTVEMPPDL